MTRTVHDPRVRFETRFKRAPSWLTFDASAILLLVLISSLFVAYKAPQNFEFSPFDEYVYADYLDKFPSQFVVRAGDETGETARNELSCRGVLYFETEGEACNAGTHDRDERYPYEGTTAADIYSPVYFGVTWVLAQPLVAVGVGLVDAGRLVGAVWLSLGTALMFVLLRRLRVDRMVALAGSLLVLAAPVTYWNSTYISTDAPTLAIAAGMGVLAVDVIRRRRSGLWLVPFAVLAVLTKVQNIGTVGLVALAVLIAAVHPAFGPARDRSETKSNSAKRHRSAGLVVTACGMVVAAVLAQGTWLVIRSALRAPDFVPTPIDFNNPDLTVGAFAGEAFRFITHVGDAGAGADAVDNLTVSVLTILCVTGAVGLSLSSAQTGVNPAQRWLVGVPTLAMCLLFGPLLAVGSQLIAGYYFALPYRYGVVLLPFLVCCAAVFFARVDWIRYPALALGSCLAVAAFL